MFFLGVWLVPSPSYGPYDLPQGGDCFLAKELDASKNYLNASALKMLLTVLKVSWLVGLLKKNECVEMGRKLVRKASLGLPPRS